MASATAFLDSYVSAPEEEEDFFAPTKNEEESEKESVAKKDKTEIPETTKTEDATDFLTGYIKPSSESDIKEEPISSSLKTAIETQPAQVVNATEGSSISGAQSLLSGLLTDIQKTAEKKQEEIKQELKETASILPVETEAYKTLEQQTKSFFGQSLQDISTTSEPQQDLTTTPQSGTKFLDQYISDVSTSVKSGAQSALDSLLGKPVTVSQSAPTVYETFKQNLGNAQTQIITKSQQTGNSFVANQNNYTTSVNTTGSSNSYFVPSTTSSSVSSTAPSFPSQSTSAQPVKSNPQSSSQLTSSSSAISSAQKSLENATGVSTQKNSLNQNLSTLSSATNNFADTVAEKAFTPNALENTTSALKQALNSVPPDQRKQVADNFLDSFLNSLSGAASALGERFQQADKNLAAITGEPGSFFLRHLAGNQEKITESDVSLNFLRGLDGLLSEPQNAEKLKQLKKGGDAVTLTFGYPDEKNKSLVALSLGASAVAYIDPVTGRLKITDTKDADGNSTIKDGKWTGKDGVYMFDKDTDGKGYKIDAAAFPGAAELLEAMEKMGIGRGKFPIDIDFNKDKPEDIIEKLAKGARDFTRDALEKIAEAAKNGYDQATNFLMDYLEKLKINNPFEKNPDLSSAEWLLGHMATIGWRPRSTAELNEMFSMLYGTTFLGPDVLKQFQRYGMKLSKEQLERGFVTSMPVPHIFSRPEQRETIMEGGVLTSGPVWFQEYLTRNPALRGIKSSTKEEYDFEKLLRAAQKKAADAYKQALENLRKHNIDWNQVMRDAAAGAGRATGGLI